jgi:hypothetical protein
MRWDRARAPGSRTLHAPRNDDPRAATTKGVHVNRTRDHSPVPTCMEFVVRCEDVPIEHFNWSFKEGGSSSLQDRAAFFREALNLTGKLPDQSSVCRIIEALLSNAPMRFCPSAERAEFGCTGRRAAI